MKKINKLLLFGVFIALLIIFGSSCENRKTEEPTPLDDLPKEQEIKDAAVAILQDKIVYGDRDELSISPNGKLESIEIRTKETAELLYRCIRNSKTIEDLTGAALKPMAPGPVKIGGESICYFDGIYITIPQFNRFYYIKFEKTDSETFYEYVMKLIDELPKDQEIKDAAIAILQGKMVYGDKDEISISTNNELESIEIRIQETAEMLYRCIRNSNIIEDLTGVERKQLPNAPVKIAGDNICNFDGIYITIPQFDRTYYIEFAKDDAKAFYEYVMKLIDDLPKEQEIKDATIAILQDKMVYGDKDEISISTNGELESIEIKTQKTAELLYSCIRNGKEIEDYTGIPVETKDIHPIKIAGESVCYFDGIYITIPQFDRFYYIGFEKNDSEAFYEHVMKLIDDLSTEQKIKDAAIAILQDKMVYGDKDEISKSRKNGLRIEIRTQETAELLYRCIRNSKTIEDLTNEERKQLPNAPVRIGGESICYFNGIYIEIPQFDGYYFIEFPMDDQKAFYDYILELIDDLPTEQEIKDATIAILQDKMAYGDKDEISISTKNELESIEIKTKKTAELLYSCIRNSNIIEDLPGVKSAQEITGPVKIAGDKVCDFDGIYIEIPQFDRTYYIEFSKDDANAFYEYVMKLIDDFPIEQKIKNAAVAILQKKIYFTGADYFSILPNGGMESIEIRTQKTADMLYRCIRNSKKIKDVTGINIEPKPYTVRTLSGGICDFDGIYIEIPQFDRTYYIEFPKAEAEAFYRYVMKLIDELPTDQDVKDATIAILQKKMVYGDKDEIFVSSSGELISIDIKTAETAELLFRCIRNSKKIEDNTGIPLAPTAPGPVKIAGESVCHFDRIYITIPQFNRFYYIKFEKNDSEAFYQHVMKLKDEYIAGQSKQ